MKNKRRFISILLVLAMVLSLLPVTVMAAGEQLWIYPKRGYQELGIVVTRADNGNVLTHGMDLNQYVFRATQRVLIVSPVSGTELLEVSYTGEDGTQVPVPIVNGKASIPVYSSHYENVQNLTIEYGAVELSTLKTTPSVSFNSPANNATYRQGDTVIFSATVSNRPTAGSQVVFTAPNGEKLTGYVNGTTGVAEASWVVPDNYTVSNATIAAQFLGTDELNAASATERTISVLTRTLNVTSGNIQVIEEVITQDPPSTTYISVAPENIITDTPYYQLRVDGVTDAQGTSLDADDYVVAFYKSYNRGDTWVELVGAANASADRTYYYMEDPEFDTINTLYKAVVTPAGNYHFGEFELVIGPRSMYTPTVGLTVAAADGGVLREGKAATLTATVTAGTVDVDGGSIKFYENTTLIGEAAVQGGTAVLNLTGYELGRTLLTGENDYLAVYSGIDGVYSEAEGLEENVVVSSGRLPENWTVVNLDQFESVTQEIYEYDFTNSLHDLADTYTFNDYNTTLNEDDIGETITLAAMMPQYEDTTDPNSQSADTFPVLVGYDNLNVRDHYIRWFMSTDGGASYTLMEQFDNEYTIEVSPENNQYCFQAIVYPDGDYYQPTQGIAVAPIRFEGALNDTYAVMRSLTASPYENSQMVISVDVIDTLNNDDDLDDVPVKSGYVTLYLDGDEIERKSIDGTGSAVFTVITPDSGAYLYSAKYTDNKRVYDDCETSNLIQTQGEDTIEAYPDNGGIPGNNYEDVIIGDGPDYPDSSYVYSRSTTISFAKGDGIEIYEDSIAPNNLVTEVIVGDSYIMVPPEVYSSFEAWVYDDIEEDYFLRTYWIKLIEGKHFYYEWQESRDSGNTWTTYGNRERILYNVMMDDDTIYRVRAIPTGDYLFPTGGITSDVTVEPTRRGSFGNYITFTDWNGHVRNDFYDRIEDLNVYENNDVTINAELFYALAAEDNIEKPTDLTVDFFYATVQEDGISDWQYLGTDNTVTFQYYLDDADIGEVTGYIAAATITTDELPVDYDGRRQQVVLRAITSGNNVYAPEEIYFGYDGLTEDTEQNIKPELDRIEKPITVWSSVPYVNLTTEDMPYVEYPIGIIITGEEATYSDGVDAWGSSFLDVSDQGEIPADGSLYRLSLTTPLLTRDGYTPSPTGWDGYIRQLSDYDARLSYLDEEGNLQLIPGAVSDLAILELNTHYRIKWQYCNDYNIANLDVFYSDDTGPILDGSVELADKNVWHTVDESASWHSVYVDSKYATYAWRAVIEVLDTPQTRGAFDETYSKDEDIYSNWFYNEEADDGQAPYKSLARRTYYSNVIQANANVGDTATDVVVETQISPSSSGAIGGDTITINAAVYGGSNDATPNGIATLYVDPFDANGWMTLEELEDAGYFTGTGRNDDSEASLVNGEAIWTLDNIKPGIYSFRVEYTNDDETLTGVDYIYDYIVRLDNYTIEVEPFTETYDAEQHFSYFYFTINDENVDSLWRNYAGEEIDLYGVIYDNIVYYYYEYHEGYTDDEGNVVEGYYDETPTITAPIDAATYKVDAVLLDTPYLTRKTATDDDGLIVEKRAVMITDATFQEEYYDPSNTLGSINVLDTELILANVTPYVPGPYYTGYYEYGVMRPPYPALGYQEVDNDTSDSNPTLEGLPDRYDADFGVISGDTVFAKVISATAADYKVGTSDVTIIAELNGADARNYELIQHEEPFGIQIARNQVYGEWLGTTLDSFAVVDESGTTAPDMTVEYYYHGEGKIALLGTGTWDSENHFSDITTEANNWDDEDGETLVAYDLTTPGVYTVIAYPTDLDNYKGGSSTKMTVTVDENGNVTRTVEATSTTLVQPTFIDIGDTAQIYDGTRKDVSLTFSNSAYEFENATITYYLNGAETTPIMPGRYAVVVTLNDASPYHGAPETYTAAGILTIYRAQPSYSVTMKGWTYGEAAEDPLLIPLNSPASIPAPEVYYTYSGGSINGISYEKPVDAGVYVVTAHVDNTDNYAKGTFSTTFEIAKKPIKAQVTNTNNQRFGTLYRSDVEYYDEGLLVGDSVYDDIMIQPSFIQTDRSNEALTNVGPYYLDAVGVSFGSDVDVDSGDFDAELGSYTAYSRNYVIETISGTTNRTDNQEKVDLTIHGLSSTVHYGDIIDLWSEGNTGYRWGSDEVTKYVSESAIVRWDVIASDNFDGNVYIDAETGRLYVDGVGDFAVFAFRGMGNNIIYTYQIMTAEQRPVTVLLDEDDYIYDGTPHVYNQNLVSSMLLEPMDVTIADLRDQKVPNNFGHKDEPGVATENPNPYFEYEEVTLFQEVDHSYTWAYNTRTNVGTTITTATLVHDYYEGSASNRLVVHHSYKDVTPNEFLVEYGTGYLNVRQGDTYYQHTVGDISNFHTLGDKADMDASGEEVMTLTDAYVLGDANRRADVGDYTTFVAGGTESDNYIYVYHDNTVEVITNDDNIITSKVVDASGSTITSRIYGVEGSYVDYDLYAQRGDTLADFELGNDFIYAAAATQKTGSGIYERAIKSAADVNLDHYSYTGVAAYEAWLSNSVNHAERADSDIYTIEASVNAAAPGNVNHYGESFVGAYNLYISMRNRNRSYINYDEIASVITGKIQGTISIEARPIELLALRLALPYGITYENAHETLLNRYELAELSTSNMGYAYGHDIADLELQFYLANQDGQYLDADGNVVDAPTVNLESYLATMFTNADDDDSLSYCFIPVIRNTNYILTDVTFVDESDQDEPQDPDIDITITLENAWGIVTWSGDGRTYTNRFTVTFYRSYYDRDTRQWVYPTEQIILTDDDVDYVIRKYDIAAGQAIQGTDGIVTSGTLTNPTTSDFTYRATYDPIYETVQVFFDAEGYSFISVVYNQ